MNASGPARTPYQASDRWLAEGEAVGRINALQGVRAEAMMVRTPDGSGTLELVKFHAPADHERPSPAPPNRLGFRQVALEVNNLDTVLDGLRDSGFDTVGAVLEYGGTYRLCYVRGPEGLIIELAERVAGERAP